nr:hypothetical protein [Brevibacillus laterosporus]
MASLLKIFNARSTIKNLKQTNTTKGEITMTHFDPNLPVTPFDNPTNHLIPDYVSIATNSTVAGKADTEIGAGVYGSNPKGNGVWGVSVSSKHSGVLGENSAKGGVGVKGESEDWYGVYGTGFYGVAGVGKNIGVYAHGAELAGLFKGNVEITENLIVQGVNFRNLLQHISRLEEEVSKLLVSGSGSSTNSPRPHPNIGTKLLCPPFGSTMNLWVFGGGFQAFESVTVFITILVNNQLTNSLHFFIQANNNGSFDTTVSVFCTPGAITTFNVKAKGSSSGDSNFTEVSC